MKTNISQLINSLIHDNKEYIKDSGYETVSEYIINENENAEYGYYYYLTDEEIELFEKDSNYEENAKKEINEYINKYYNIPVSELE